MSLRLSILLIGLSVISGVAQKKWPEPYGMVSLNSDLKKSYPQDVLWMDDTEITNNEYRQFLNSLSKEHREEYRPDTLCFAPSEYVPEIAGWESISRYYFWHPAYDEYPVVGVSPEQVRAFCAWRTEYYNQNIKVEGYKIEFRIPSLEDYLQYFVFEDGSEYLGGYYTLDGKGNKVESRFVRKNKIGTFNHGREGKEGQYGRPDISDSLVFSNKVKQTLYSVNLKESTGQEIYGIAGNVAELAFSSDGEPLLFGGSWLEPAEHATFEFQFGSELFYRAPAPHVGFRCVAVWIKDTQ